MASAFIVINAPKTLVVTAAGLQTAISAARPGTILVVETTGAAIDMTLNGLEKAGYGVCILLPLDQTITCSLLACRGLHFFGGYWSADIVRGTTVSGNYGLDIQAGCSKISLNGSYLERNANGVVVDHATDFSMIGCRGNINRSDGVQAIASSRLAFEDNVFETGSIGQKFCYFPDGRSPTEGQPSSTCTAAGGIWEDTAHNDLIQARDQCTDVTIKNNVSDQYLAQGFDSFGAAEEDNYIYRVLCDGNTLNNVSVHGIWFRGTDIDVRNNTVTESPDSTIPPRITLVRIDEDSRIQAGNNVAPNIMAIDGVDPASPTINGDPGVVPPEAPRIALPAWKPDTPVPPATPAAVPAYVNIGGIRPSGTPAVDDWLTINKGQWSGAQGATWEFRWTRNGTPISGATAQVYQVVADDVGQNLNVEVRGTNGVGVGEWASYTAVVPA